MRKRNKKAALLKRTMKAVPLVLAVGAFGYGGVRFAEVASRFEMPEVMPITNIEVNGEFVYSGKQAIHDIVERNINGGYFTLDLDPVRDRLLQQPWVESVNLRRQWPAQLTVDVQEQQPVAYWNEKSFINDKGNVFTPKVMITDLELPHFFGPRGQHEMVWKFMNTLYQEMALLDYEVVSLKMDARHAWQIEVASNHGHSDSPIKVRLGRFDTDKRLKRFVAILPALAGTAQLDENMIDVIDMRYPNGFAVKKKDTKDKILTSKNEENRQYNQKNNHRSAQHDRERSKGA
jgi:cell division protein FtsQ